MSQMYILKIMLLQHGGESDETCLSPAPPTRTIPLDWKLLWEGSPIFLAISACVKPLSH